MEIQHRCMKAIVMINVNETKWEKVTTTTSLTQCKPQYKASVFFSMTCLLTATDSLQANVTTSWPYTTHGVSDLTTDCTDTTKPKYSTEQQRYLRLIDTFNVR